jgi:putative ATPase
MHLRDGHPLQKRQEGREYRYPHADPRGWVEQEHVGGELPQRYYVPSAHGEEPGIADRLSRRRGDAE